MPTSKEQCSFKNNDEAKARTQMATVYLRKIILAISSTIRKANSMAQIRSFRRLII